MDGCSDNLQQNFQNLYQSQMIYAQHQDHLGHHHSNRNDYDGKSSQQQLQQQIMQHQTIQGRQRWGLRTWF